jgi:hypothetical protein
MDVGLVGAFLFCKLVVAVAGTRILRRLGYSGWGIIIGLLPVVNIVGLCYLAFTPWPPMRRVYRA